MKVTRIYTGPDNESHFEDLEIPLGITRRVGRGSEPMKAVEIIFIETSGIMDWHTAPCRQFVITLEGEGEIEVRDGTKRRFGPGDVLLAEDVTGGGHISRVLGNGPKRTAFIPLD